MTTPFRAALVAVSLLFAVSASAQDRAAPAAMDTTRFASVLGGFEFEDETGFGLRGDVEFMPLASVGAKGTLKLIGSVGWTHYGTEEFGVDVTSNVFRFIPGVRLSIPLQDRLGVYADGGLGLYHARTSVEDFDVDENDTHLLLRFAGGGFYEVSESLRVVAELGVQPHFGDFDINPVTLFGGLSFAF